MDGFLKSTPTYGAKIALSGCTVFLFLWTVFLFLFQFLSKLPEVVDWRGDTGRSSMLISFSSTWLSLKQYLGHLSCDLAWLCAPKKCPERYLSGDRDASISVMEWVHSSWLWQRWPPVPWQRSGSEQVVEQPKHQQFVLTHSYWASTYSFLLYLSLQVKKSSYMFHVAMHNPQFHKWLRGPQQLLLPYLNERRAAYLPFYFPPWMQNIVPLPNRNI